VKPQITSAARIHEKPKWGKNPSFRPKTKPVPLLGYEKTHSR